MSNQSYTFGNNEITISEIEGTVIDSNRNSETHVSGHGGGGGGFVVNGYGLSSNSNVQISSHTTHSREFWLKLDDGEEKHFDWNIDFPLRTGQRISVLLSKSKNGGCYSSVINHDAKKYTKITTPKEANKILNIVESPQQSIFIGFLTFGIAELVLFLLLSPSFLGAMPDFLFSLLNPSVWSSIANSVHIISAIPAILYILKSERKRKDFFTLYTSQLASYAALKSGLSEERGKDFVERQLAPNRKGPFINKEHDGKILATLIVVIALLFFLGN